MTDELNPPDPDQHFAEALASIDSARVFLHDALEATGASRAEEGTLRVVAALMEVTAGLVAGLRQANAAIAEIVRRVSELEDR